MGTPKTIIDFVVTKSRWLTGALAVLLALWLSEPTKSDEAGDYQTNRYGGSTIQLSSGSDLAGQRWNGAQMGLPGQAQESPTRVSDPPPQQPPLDMVAGSPAFLQALGKIDDSAGKVGAAGGVIGFSHSDGSGSLIITLVDTGKSWMAVYHISRVGEIRLMSSRPIETDFSLLLNPTSPTPSEISAVRAAR